MTDEILARLRVALDADPRKDRAISLDAELGPNYIRGIYEEGKKPSVEKLMQILSVLDDESTVRVLTGMELDKDDMIFLKLLPAMTKKTKRNAIDLIQGLLSDAADGSNPKEPLD